MRDVGKVSSVSVSSFKSMFNIPTLGEDRFKYPLPREGKISQKTQPRANNNNQIPTPCPAPPPAGFKLIGALPVMCLLCFYQFSEHLEAVLGDFLLNGQCDVTRQGFSNYISILMYFRRKTADYFRKKISAPYKNSHALVTCEMPASILLASCAIIVFDLPMTLQVWN